MNELIKTEVIDRREVLGVKFRIFGDLENPLFYAKDVAEWIDYAKTGKGAYDVSRMLTTVDDDEKLIRTIFVSGQNRQLWFVTEDGLYEILMQSRKPIAKEFKREVKAILKSIRKHGAYLTPAKIEEVLLNPDTIIKLATDLKNERLKNLRLEAEKEENAPLIAFAEQVKKSNDSLLVREFAKICCKHGIEIGEKRLYKKLREWGMIFENSTEPYQKYVDNGYFEVVEVTAETPNGVKLCSTTRVLPRGQVAIIAKLRKESELAALAV